MIDVETERQRLAQDREKVQQGIERSQKMLENPSFVSKAKAEVVERERKNLADLQASLEQINQRFESLSKI